MYDLVNVVIIGSGNGFAPRSRQAIRPLLTNTQKINVIIFFQGNAFENVGTWQNDSNFRPYCDKP